jgi:hypothetical protein
MSQQKKVTKIGMRRSVLLGSADPRHRREPQQRFDPRADSDAEALKKRIEALEKKAK